MSSPYPIKITRSRTAQNRLLRDKMRPPTEQLRSIVKKSDEDPEKTKKKRGKKRQHGVRFGGTGGSDLISTSDEVPGPSTQTAEFGQTCQPRTSSKISQAIGCLRCDGLGHVATICTNTPTAANAGRPPAYYCHRSLLFDDLQVHITEEVDDRSRHLHCTQSRLCAAGRPC